MGRLACLIAVVVVINCAPILAQVAPTAQPDQESLLQSHDKKLAQNKKLVYDFWREVLEARHMELAEK